MLEIDSLKKGEIFKELNLQEAVTGLYWHTTVSI